MSRKPYVPQVSWPTLEKALIAIRKAEASGEELERDDLAAAIGFGPREASYAMHGLTFLGWTSARPNSSPSKPAESSKNAFERISLWPARLSDAGRRAADSEQRRRADALDLLYSWQPTLSLEKGRTDEAVAALTLPVEQGGEGLSHNTALRRAQSLFNWLVALDVIQKNSDESESVEREEKRTRARAERAAALLRRKENAAVQASLPAMEAAFGADISERIFSGDLPVESLPPGADEERLSMARDGHRAYAERLRAERGGRCQVSRSSLGLRASHIKPWSKSSPFEKTDVANGLLLNETWDMLFDGGWVSFDADGKIIISPLLSEEERSIRRISGDERLSSPPSADTAVYLDWHARNILRAEPDARSDLGTEGEPENRRQSLP